MKTDENFENMYERAPFPIVSLGSQFRISKRKMYQIDENEISEYVKHNLAQSMKCKIFDTIKIEEIEDEDSIIFRTRLDIVDRSNIGERFHLSEINQNRSDMLFLLNSISEDARNYEIIILAEEMKRKIKNGEIKIR